MRLKFQARSHKTWANLWHRSQPPLVHQSYLQEATTKAMLREHDECCSVPLGNSLLPIQQTTKNGTKEWHHNLTRWMRQRKIYDNVTMCFSQHRAQFSCKNCLPSRSFNPFFMGAFSPKWQAATGVICPHNLKGQGKNLGTSKLKGPRRRNQNFSRLIQCLAGTRNTVYQLTEHGFRKAVSLEKNWRKCGTMAATLLHSLVTTKGSQNNCKMH